MHLLSTFLLSLLIAGLLGASYKFGYTKIILELKLHTTWLIPLLSLIVWLGAVALLPLLAGIGGFIGNITTKRRNRIN
jgi:hypothetical protein